MSEGSLTGALFFMHPSQYLPKVLALAAIYGRLDFQHVHNSQYYDDPRVEAFKERIKVIPWKAGTTEVSSLQRQLRIHTCDGNVLSEVLPSDPPPMSEKEIHQKFGALVGLRVSEKKALGLERKLEGIEKIDNIAPLIRELELPIKNAKH